jgi:DNA-binding transcriptional LysR family regulator
VEIRIRDGEQQELVQALTAGSIDLAMLFEHDLDGTIETTPLMPPQQPYACCRPTTASRNRRKCRCAIWCWSR